MIPHYIDCDAQVRTFLGQDLEKETLNTTIHRMMLRLAL
jgi:hypothetical protein